jgi:hypothetical protein
MKAQNGALTYDDSLMFFKSFNILSLVVVALTILQFLISTYYHKMIGLETIQCVQTVYFIRMAAKDLSYAGISGFNLLKYSNGYNDITDSSTSSRTYNSVPSAFANIGLSLDFTDNVNIMQVPIIIFVVAYLVCVVRKSLIKY